MSLFLPRPLLKLFAPRPPLEYMPPTTKIKRRVIIKGCHTFLKGLQIIKQTDAMDTTVDDSTYEQELKRQYANRNKKTITSNPYATLFVGGLPKQIQEQDLILIAEEFGKVASISLIKSKRSRYAFIEYESEQSIRKALRGFPRRVLDKKIIVDVEKGRNYKQFKPNKYKLIK